MFFTGSDDSFDGNYSISADIVANITKQPLSFKGMYEEVVLVVGPTTLTYGKQVFNLTESRSTVIVSDLKGSISYDEEVFLSGKASELQINGIAVPGKNTINIKNASFDSITINSVEIPSLTNVVTGVIAINDGRTLLLLDNERITLVAFRGSILVNDKLNLEGNISAVSIQT